MLKADKCSADGKFLHIICFYSCSKSLHKRVLKSISMPTWRGLFWNTERYQLFYACILSVVLHKVKNGWAFGKSTYIMPQRKDCGAIRYKTPVGCFDKDVGLSLASLPLKFFISLKNMPLLIIMSLMCIYSVWKLYCAISARWSLVDIKLVCCAQRTDLLLNKCSSLTQVTGWYGHVW